MNTLRVIFVHGISPVIIRSDYTAGFCDLLRSELEALGVVPKDAGDEQTAEIVTFERVDYSAIGQPEEERVLTAYLRERQGLYHFPDLLIEKIGFENIRRQLITSVSDVLVYESDHWRDAIRNLLVGKIDPYVRTRDAVTLVGHSLGSVVAFDTAYYHSRHDPKWLAARFKPTNLFTLGSPIALFTLELDDATGLQKPRYLPADATPPDRDPHATNPDLQPIRGDGVWYNFLDAQDLIAYPLAEVFRDKFRVEDIPVETGILPLQAHTGYWSNREVARRIAERLKSDFDRINSA